MTATDMSYEFNIVYESIASMAAPGYTEREKSVLLTQAQEEIIIEGPNRNQVQRTMLYYRNCKHHTECRLLTG